MNKLPKLSAYEEKLLKYLYPKDTQILYDTHTKHSYFCEDDIKTPVVHSISLKTFEAFLKHKLIEMRWGIGPFTGWRLTTQTKKLLQDILEPPEEPEISTVTELANKGKNNE